MGFSGAYVLISLATPFYLKKIGELKAWHIVVCVMAESCSDRPDRRAGLSGSALPGECAALYLRRLSRDRYHPDSDPQPKPFGDR